MSNLEGKPTPPLFLANIPRQIEAEWNLRYAYLAGFPLNIVFTGRRPSDEAAQPYLVAACYWFDFRTYEEDEELREMCYYPNEESPYCLRVSVRKDTGVWETFKYRDEELVCSASGATFEAAMMQTTIIGLQPDEPESDPSYTPAKTRSNGR